MTKSKAKKQREKLLREGKRDPVLNRGTYALADMNTRVTKTKHEKVNQVKHKKRLSDQDDHGTDGRFFTCQLNWQKCLGIATTLFLFHRMSTELISQCSNNFTCKGICFQRSVSHH